MKIESTEKTEAAEIRREFVELTHRLGRIEFAKRALEKERQDVEKQFDDLEQRESSFIEGLTKKYGAGSLDIETGEFTSEVSK